MAATGDDKSPYGAATIVKSIQNEVAQCVQLVEVGAASNQVLVEKAKQSSLAREGQAIK